METEVAIRGSCILSSAGETAIALCENNIFGNKLSEQVNLQIYEKEIAAQDTGPRELYRVQKLLLIAFLKAVYMAGVNTKTISPDRMGVFLGNSYGIEEFKTEFFRLYKKSTPSLTRPTLFPFTNANSLASWLAIQGGAKGLNLTFVSGSTSSADAILTAYESLIANECDIAFVGGISIIDNNLSDEFYDSGFKYESAGILVLERNANMSDVNRKPSVVLRNYRRTFLTQEQMKGLVHRQSVKMNDKWQKCINDAREIIYFGNDLGDNIFDYGRDNPNEVSDQSKRLYLSDLVGNVFDEAGVLGVSLGAELLNLGNDAKWNPFNSVIKDMVCLFVNSKGTCIDILLSKT